MVHGSWFMEFPFQTRILTVEWLHGMCSGLHDQTRILVLHFLAFDVVSLFGLGIVLAQVACCCCYFYCHGFEDCSNNCREKMVQ